MAPKFRKGTRKRLSLLVVMISFLVPGLAGGLEEGRVPGPVAPGFEKAAVLLEQPVAAFDGRKFGHYILSVDHGKYLEAIDSESSKGVRLPLLWGKGKFLAESMAKCEASARRMIETRFGQAGEIGQPALIRGGPLSYWASFTYSQGGKELGNLLFDLMTQRTHPMVPSQRCAAGIRGPDEVPLPAEKGTPPRSEILTNMPVYPLFLSDRASCLAMILGYWAAHGYPEIMTLTAPGGGKGIYTGPHFYREWIREIDLVGRGCSDCRSVEKVIELFTLSRKCPMVTKRLEKEALPNASKVIESIQRMVDAKQPFLVEDILSEPPRYAVGIGYLVSAGWPFVACLVPAMEGLGSAWDPVFVNWSADSEYLRFYQIMPSGAPGN